MPDSRALPVTQSEAPETILDGVDWPGPLLLLLGVALLAWTMGDNDAGISLRLLGVLATVVSLATGFAWIAVEHQRFRASSEKEHHR
ncbi:hypothetical protein GPX89_06375 [Nocardia sp. ET3-3]|uniref:Uncharacterized protein n=1 Tax=Nocardia terrae TaxID=2675851 RepID=A0A7K1URU2_9NOCA|nr:hypothetical protein [Nocardia terrae]MVU76869.1 hypothetical protein [Nocardia terrae]